MEFQCKFYLCDLAHEIIKTKFNVNPMGIEIEAFLRIYLVFLKGNFLFYMFVKLEYTSSLNVRFSRYAEH